MNPNKVRRDRLSSLTDLPNIGPAMAEDLRLLGFDRPEQLAGQDPLALFDRLCELTGARQDPCILDVFVSVIRFMDGDDPRPWWFFTPERKNPSVPRT
ncbi:MAG: mitomycin resistance protein [Desulfovibrionales bacterium]|nr:mitomycin resistance protein [Desulfovibrionales bacterium]